MTDNMIKQFALNMILSNPQIYNTPFGQQCAQAIQTGDSQKGTELAMNFLNSIGMTREQVMNQAKERFNIR